MADINSMLVSFSASIPFIEKLTTGFGYVLGICFIIYSINQFHDLAERHTRHNVKGGYFGPIAYLLMGSALLWLPSSVNVLEDTLFGSNSLLAYSGTITSQLTRLYANPSYIVTQILKMMGFIWFVRGCSLIAASSDPGVQHGVRGLLFIIGGIFALNYTAAFELVKSTMQTWVTSVHNLYPIQQTIQSLL